jgi:hypothetical protein
MCDRADGTQANYGAQTGGIVELRAAVWNVNVTVILRDGVVIRGQGPRATLCRFTTHNGPAFDTGAGYNPSPSVSRCEVHDLAIDHATVGAAGTAGINFSNCIFPYAKNVEVFNLAEYGIRFGDETHFGLAERCDCRGEADAFLLENGSRSTYILNSRAASSPTGIRVAEGANAGSSNCGVAFSGFSQCTTGVVTQALTTGGVFHTLVLNNRIESSVAGAVGVSNGVGAQFTALIGQHYQGSLAGGKVVDSSGASGELLSIEYPVFYGVKIGELSGARGSHFVSGNGDPNGVRDGKAGDLYYRRDLDGMVYRKVTPSGQLTGWMPAMNRGMFATAAGVY